MPYLIDGHNLIPKLGLRLDALEDEMELVNKLNDFCRASRRSQVEIYFDNAQPGSNKKQCIGLVDVYFVRKPLIADDAILLRLKKLQKDARNWIVVSSDRRVQTEARAVGARVVSSDLFANEVLDTLRNTAGQNPKTSLQENEINEWLSLFGAGSENE